MNIEISKSDNFVLLLLKCHNFNNEYSIFFKKEIDKLISQDFHNFIVDLSNVDFIDSSGLGALVTCLKKVTPNGDIILCSLRHPIKQTFDLTRMNQIFKIFASKNEALEALKK